MKKTHLVTLIFSAALVMAGCNDGDMVGSEEATHDHDSEEGGNSEEVHLVQKQMDVMNITLGTFQYLNLSTTVKSNGQLELPPQNKASLSAVMGGRVKSVNVLEGDYVMAGQTLATIEHPDFVDLQEQYLTAKADLEFLENDFLRQQELYRDSISSGKEFQEAESVYQSGLASVNALKAKLQILDIDVATVENGTYLTAIPIRSPINGYIHAIEINMGMFVQPDQDMFEIFDNAHIHIDLKVYEKDMDKVENGQKVIFALTSRPDSIFEGSIFAIGKSFEKEPKAMEVHAEIENKTGNLLPGMYVDARIVTNSESVLAVPNDAIVKDGGISYIFILKDDAPHDHDSDDDHSHGSTIHQDDEMVFRMIEVNTGATDIGFTEVVPAYELDENVQIVISGAFYLLAEMKKGEGGEHHH